MTFSGKWRQVSELKVYNLILVDTDFVIIKIKVCCLLGTCSGFTVCGHLVGSGLINEMQIIVKV